VKEALKEPAAVEFTMAGDVTTIVPSYLTVILEEAA